MNYDFKNRYKLFKNFRKVYKKNESVINFDNVKDLIEKALKKINNQDINIDLNELKANLYGYYRIRKGDLRIVFSYNKGLVHIVNIENIDFRGSVY